MKTYFKFMRKRNAFQPEDVVYHVAVGNTSREICDLVSVKEVCKHLEYYFEVVNDESDEFICKAHKMAFKGISMLRVNFRHVSISINSLKQLIISNSFAKYESQLTVNIELEYFLHINDPIWLLNHKSFVLQNSYSPVQRKNLRHAC